MEQSVALLILRDYSILYNHTLQCKYTLLWSWKSDLNRWPTDYKSAALPAELNQQIQTLARCPEHGNICCPPSAAWRLFAWTAGAELPAPKKGRILLWNGWFSRFTCVSSNEAMRPRLGKGKPWCLRSRSSSWEQLYYTIYVVSGQWKDTIYSV